MTDVEVPLQQRLRKGPSQRVSVTSEGGKEYTVPEAMLESKRVEHSCGVFGVLSAKENASRVVFFALYALNHRGQESAGIASYDATGVHVHKGMGLVSQVFDESDIAQLKGSMAIGHTRYSTSGGSKLTGAQPFVLETDLGQLAIAHNGQVARQVALRKIVLSRGVGLFTNSDSEIIAQMLARPHDPAEAAAYAAAPELGAHVVDSWPQGAAATTGETGSSPADHATPSIASSGAAAGASASASSSSGALVTSGGIPVWAAWVARMAAFMRDCEGAYSIVAVTKDSVYGIRDPYGLRPLCIGKVAHADGTHSYHLSSESCALATVGATLVRDVAPGEIVRLDRAGVRAWRPLEQPVAPAIASLPRTPAVHAFCIFEYVYFARPDSTLEGRQVHTVRTRLGAQLAKEAPAPTADLVSGVPDSSIAAAIGFANTTGLPFSEVFCKNRYIGRTFIKPDDTLRKNAIQLKYNPLTDVLAGKSIVLVDDSLVRGNTLRQLVPLLRRGGAREVHVRISSPPIRHPCYYGVDIGSYEELITSHMATVEAVREYIGADSLAYLSHEGMVSAVEGGDDGKPAGHCSGCFTGVYPVAHDI